MAIIEGIGDEVTVFGILTLVLIFVLSFSYVWSAFTAQISNRVEPPARNSNEVVYENNNSPSTEDNPASGCDGNGSTNTIDNSVNHCAANNGVERNREIEDPNSSAADELVSSAEQILSSLSDMVESWSSLSRTVTSSEGVSDSNVDLNQQVRNQTQVPSPEAGVIQTEDSDTDQIVIRIKYLNDTERTINTRLSKTIADFKRDNFAEEIAANKLVRLIFNGQVLQNDSTLHNCGISDGCVIHVHISQNMPQGAAPSVESNPNYLDVSNLLWPLLFVILVLLWILNFKYPQFFNVTATGILLVLTGGFMFFYGETRIHGRE